MHVKLTMLYWKGERYWVGKILERPDIMTQGETLEQLEENLKDAYMMMVTEDPPDSYQLKEITLLRDAGCVLHRHGPRHDIYLIMHRAKAACAPHIKKHLGKRGLPASARNPHPLGFYFVTSP